MISWEDKNYYHLKTDITILQNLAKPMRINVYLLFTNSAFLTLHICAGTNFTYMCR